jgi:hypothetical protein
VCKFFNAKRFQPKPGDLPPDRTAIIRPFQVIGVDFAGPLFCYDDPLATKRPRTRASAKNEDPDYVQPKTKKEGEKKLKGLYGFAMLITCASTRLVQFYFTEDQTAKSVALAYNNHTAIYGAPSKVYSDNGSGFVSMKGHLERISAEIYPTTIWETIPPFAPWWGGFYERMVGMMKAKLHAVSRFLNIRNALHGHYVLQHISGCLNNRPMWIPSNDVADKRAITPNSFIHMMPTKHDIKDVDPANSSSKIALQRLHAEQTKAIDQLWKEFHLGYLVALRDHQKVVKNADTTSLKVGEYVLYHCPQTVRNFWPIGQVTSVLPGPDGTTRAVRLRKYVPNQINLPLKQQRFGRREKLTLQERQEVTGYWKDRKNVYPVHKLVRYEFWDSPEPTPSAFKDTSVVPTMMIEVAGQKYFPKPVVYRQQEPGCEDINFPITKMSDKLKLTVLTKKGMEKDYLISPEPYRVTTAMNGMNGSGEIQIHLTLLSE